MASCSFSLAGLGGSSSSALLPGASLESASALGGTLHMLADCRSDEACTAGWCCSSEPYTEVMAKV